MGDQTPSQADGLTTRPGPSARAARLCIPEEGLPTHTGAKLAEADQNGKAAPSTPDGSRAGRVLRGRGGTQPETYDHGQTPDLHRATER